MVAPDAFPGSARNTTLKALAASHPLMADSIPARRLSPPGGARHHGTDQTGHLGYLSTLELLDLEGRALHRRHGVPVAVAAVGEHEPRPVQPVLPAGESGLGRAHVLDEEQAASRL